MSQHHFRRNKLQEKRSIGFDTPSKELQDAFAEIQTQLSKKKLDWKEIEKKATKRLAKVKNAGIAWSIVTVVLVARLGIEVAETHGRLAKVEKAIKESKLR